MRYPLPLLLILALLAATGGAKTFLETAEHAADLPAWLLSELGACSCAVTPSGWTFSRMLGRVDHDEPDQAFSGWTAQGAESAETVTVDGKTMQAAHTGQTDMPQTQVVAAMNSHGEVLGQSAVAAGDENAAAEAFHATLKRETLHGRGLKRWPRSVEATR
ncbi:DDE family transposase [Haloactinospora alba]|uniref:DDE family transposase n=1 Tax=Haloactinospora alba TaxID=405555 RepID=A0A543NJY1_9ACTN|nr:DDE family transposase [Haloactinospora alba]